MTSKIIVIAGMHRSGTSLISQYLDVCGLDVGEKLHSTDNSNQDSAFDGHHEDKEFMDFHRDILYGQHLYFPSTELRLPIKVDNPRKQKAIELIASRKHKSLWGWKDPETTLFLDFWHDILPDPGYLFLFRHPLAVVDSLVRRKNDTKISNKPIVGLRVWQIYNLHLLRFWQQHPESCLLWEIDNIIQNPEKFISSINQQFQIDLDPVPFERVFTKKAFRSQYSELVENLETEYPEEFAKTLKIYDELTNVVNQGIIKDTSVLEPKNKYSLTNFKSELEDYIWQRPKLHKILISFRKVESK